MSQNHRIIYTAPEGHTCVVVPSPEWTGTMQELTSKLQSQGNLISTDIPEIVPVAEVPSDRTFRNAWKRGEQGKKIGVDMLKGKEITHIRRRAKRELEFAPHDEIIMKQLPGKSAVDAEAARVLIRTKYDTMQIAIDACVTPEELKTIVTTEGL